MDISKFVRRFEQEGGSLARFREYLASVFGTAAKSLQLKFRREERTEEVVSSLRSLGRSFKFQTRAQSAYLASNDRKIELILTA